MNGGSLIPDGGAFAIWAVIYYNLLLYSLIPSVLSIGKCNEPWNEHFIKSCDYNINWLRKFNSINKKQNTLNENNFETEIEKFKDCKKFILLLKYELFLLVKSIKDNKDKFLLTFIYNFYLRTFTTYFTWVYGACILQNQLLDNINLFKNFNDSGKNLKNIDIIKDISNKNTENAKNGYRKYLDDINQNIMISKEEFMVIKPQPQKKENIIGDKILFYPVIFWVLTNLLITFKNKNIKFDEIISSKKNYDIIEKFQEIKDIGNSVLNFVPLGFFKFCYSF